jgi:hypothetical protein
MTLYDYTPFLLEMIISAAAAFAMHCELEIVWPYR